MGRSSAAGVATLAVLATLLGGCTSSTTSTRPDQSVSGRSAAPSTSTSPTPIGTGGAAPIPSVAISAAAAQAVGTAAVQQAWADLAQWIVTTGYRTDLVRTGTPTPAQLMPVTDQMTIGCKASFDDLVRARSADDIDSLESLTTIGSTSPGATPIPGDQVVTDRAITSASADLDADQRPTFTVASAARVHFEPNGGGQPFYSLISRNTTYTLIAQDGRWLLDAWQGTYDTSDPVDE